MTEKIYVGTKEIYIDWGGSNIIQTRRKNGEVSYVGDRVVQVDIANHSYMVMGDQFYVVAITPNGFPLARNILERKVPKEIMSVFTAGDRWALRRLRNGGEIDLVDFVDKN